MTDLSQTVEGHTSDIKQLTKNVDKLAVIVEYAEKDRQQDRDTMKDVVRFLSTLSEKIQGLISIEKELAQCSKEIATTRHDLASLQTTVNGLVPLIERVTKIETKTETLETLKDRMTGGAFVLNMGAKVFWAVCGAGILALVAFGLKSYFNVDLDLGGTNVYPLPGQPF